MPKVQKAVHIRMDSTLSASSMRHGEKVDNQHPQHTSSLWRDGQDETLLKARAKGLGWQEIAAQCFPHKTANACRKRHERLMERRNQDEWDHARLEELGAAYMACRKEMWSVLADRLEDRWTNVEAKVRTTLMIGMSRLGSHADMLFDAVPREGVQDPAEICTNVREEESTH